MINDINPIYISIVGVIVRRKLIFIKNSPRHIAISFSLQRQKLKIRVY
nr:MAG TPA: hypothetical protein [Caudoviricetes sp.]